MIYPLREDFFQVTPVKTVLPIPKLVRGFKKLLHGLIFPLSRDLPLEREKVFSGTLKKGLSNGLTSGGVPQEHPISLTRQGGDNESTTE